VTQKFNFISGLPRSGSTLLGAILRQNPRFAAGMSSPVASLFENVVSQVSSGTELANMVNEAQRARILRGLFDSYYAESQAEVIFDTNRAWTAKLAELMTLFPDARLICTVRNVAWVLDSLERQFRSSTFENTGLFGNAAERATVYTRTDALASANRLVGFSYQALREACWSDHADRLVIVDYDMLTLRPRDVLKLIYEFIDEPWFEHDFEQVEYAAEKFDTALGLANLHTVLPKVEAKSRRTILPPDLFEKYASLDFWQNLENCRSFRIVQQSSSANPTGSVGPKH
jgi:sulfotransferase